LLRRRGWASEEIRAASDSLRDVVRCREPAPPTAVAAAFEDACLDGLLEWRDVSLERWSQLTRTARRSEELSRALLLVARAWWAHDEALDDELSRSG